MFRYLACAAALALTACASVTTQVVPLGAPQSYPPTQTVEVLLQPPTRPYTDIALIESHGEVGVSEADLLNDARERARTLGADAIVKTGLEPTYYQPFPVYDPWYDPLFYGYYRYRPFPPFPQPWTGPYRFVGGGVSYTLKSTAIKYQPVAGQIGGTSVR
jgi:hypothetical protein